MDVRKIAVRVDASNQIGTGHFMRCLALADKLKDQGARLRFISRHMPEFQQDMLAEKSHEFVLLTSNNDKSTSDDLFHSLWLGTSQEADANDTIQELSDKCWDWLIVDHYALDARWESKLHQSAKKIMVIDDLADRQHECDILLDQNYYTDMNSRYIGKVPSHCQLLLGPSYALLRDEFRQQREKIVPRSGPVERILIFFGGVDADNCTGCAIEAISGIASCNFVVDVIIGSGHPYRDEIESACAKHKYSCYIQTTRMAELMAKADLAIGAGGSASWERCCLGLPVIIMSLADNQTAIVKALDLVNACVYMGTKETVNTPLCQDRCRLDPNKTIAEQFDLLRVVDSKRFPAFFDYRGKRYLIKIEKRK